MPADTFTETLNDSSTGPARRCAAVAPSDSTALPNVAKALYVGGAGDVVLRAIGSTADVTWKAQAGQVIPVFVTHVRATGTTATAILALG